MGETRVDLFHLLEDLADAYPGELEETVLTEIVANALDSRAGTIALAIDTAEATLTVVDDGSGMKRVDLRRFHDVAASSKQRGEGIGFAGVGIKLGLLISETVVTETLRGVEHVATRWGMTSRRRAPWQWIAPPGIVATRGTAVRLHLSNPLSPLLDRGYLESILRAHFASLLDPYFDQILHAHYPRGVRVTLDGFELARSHPKAPLSAAVALRLPRKRLASAYGYVVRHDAPLIEQQRGIAISTYGKVIKRGWDWLGVTPASADHVTGLIEVPALAASLTLNKADFLRAGPRGALYLSYRKALQEVVMSQLAAWGDDPTANVHSRRRAARPVERDLEAILVDLSDRFPMLATIVEQRAGGRRKVATTVAGHGAEAAPVPELFDAVDESSGPTESDETSPAPTTSADERSLDERGAPASPPAGSAPEAGGQRKRQPMRLGLTIQFETRGAEDDLARLIESTVWVNDAHPAYRRAVASRSEGYHLALSVALALAAVAVAPDQERGFVKEFLARWGESVDRARSKRRKRSTPSSGDDAARPGRAARRRRPQ